MAVYRPVITQTSKKRTENEYVWSELYCALRPYILGWVYSSGVSSWHGQENDVADDILQEAIIRTLKYTRLAENGDVLPIHSVTCFGRTVAHNHFRDLRRRELRLLRPMSPDGDVSLLFCEGEEVDPSEVALERLMLTSLLMGVARIIAEFPLKQRTALLIDLANHANPDDEQRHLESAFAAVGISLSEYRRALPADPLERSRHAASLSMAYKRLKQAFRRQVYDFM
ncbi:MAG TPA: hypothetical protein VL461_05875 [Dictyobacter sp.]|jgi:DNA-directed RNA polymerase specialized sigma24 family protein|nr:hypothetical protein [Dictyobacter sp.]